MTRRGYRAVEPISPKKAVARALEDAENQHAIDRSRVEMMRGYAETDECRRRWLLNYFGEDAQQWCGNCDTCEEAVTADEDGQREPAPSEWAMQTPVRHREWGPGIVTGAQPDRLTVFFEAVGYKELSLELVAQQEDLLVRDEPGNG